MGLTAILPLIIIFFHCGLSYYLRRKFSKKFTAIKSIIFEEFICTMEISCVCAEAAFVKSQLGNTLFIVCLILVNMWWFTSFGNASANPIGPILGCIYNGNSIQGMVYRIFGQLLAVPFALRYARLFWFLGFLNDHKAIYDQTICQSDIQTWFIFAAIVEFAITFIDSCVGKMTEKYNFQVYRFLYSLSASILVFIAFNFSGGYFNPILATTLTVGCAGSSTKEAVLVYWVAALGGAIASKETLKYYEAKSKDVSKKEE